MHEAVVLLLAATRVRPFTATSAIALAALLGLGYVTLSWRRRRPLGGGRARAERDHPERFELSGRTGTGTGTPDGARSQGGRGTPAAPTAHRHTPARPGDVPPEPPSGGGAPG